MHQCDKFFNSFETITNTRSQSSLNMAFKGKIHEKCRQQQKQGLEARAKLPRQLALKKVIQNEGIIRNWGVIGGQAQ